MGDDASCSLDIGQVEAAIARPLSQVDLGPVIEPVFESATAQTRQRSCRLHLAILYLILLLCLPLDQHGGLLGEALGLRLALLGPAFAAGLLLSSSRQPSWMQGLAIAAPVVLTVIGTTWLGGMADPVKGVHYLMGAGLLAFSTNLVMPLRFWHAAAMTLANMVGFALAGLLVFDLSGTAGDLMLLLGGLCLVSLHIAWRTDRVSRNTFLYALKSDLQARILTDLNGQLELLSNTDPLTGVGNRRFFDRFFRRMVQDVGPNLRGLGLLMIDVDHFKKFNDAAGHAEGDECLRKVAAAIKAEMAGTNVVVRYGGEEFAVLMPGSRMAAMGTLGERIRMAVVELRLHNPGLQGDRVVTVSVGGAIGTLDTEIGESVQALVVAADAALYEAKTRGRNQLVLHGEPDTAWLRNLHEAGRPSVAAEPHTDALRRSA